MKKDMGGAAHAIALAELVMARKLPLRITLLVPAVENAIGPNAFRPGEVVATRRASASKSTTPTPKAASCCAMRSTYAAEQQAGAAARLRHADRRRAHRARPRPARAVRERRSRRADWLDAGSAAARSAVAHAAVASVPALPRQHRRRHRQRRPVADGRQHHRGDVPRTLRAPQRRSGRTWTCTHGTTATAPASRPVAKRRDCARRRPC